MSRVSVDSNALYSLVSWAQEQGRTGDIAALDPQPLGWQPIADAPKDVKFAGLGTFGHNRSEAFRLEQIQCATTSWDDFHGEWRAHGVQTDLIWRPTQWMPLPDAPTKETSHDS